MLTTKDIKNSEEWAVKNGTHALMYKVIQSVPCGCEVVGAGNLKSPVRIEFCPMHKAAPKLFETLEAIIINAWSMQADPEQIAMEVSKRLIRKGEQAIKQAQQKS